MQPTPAFYLNGTLVSQLTPHALEEENLTSQQHADRAISFSKAAEIFHGCADFQTKLDEANGDASATQSVVAEITALAQGGDTAAAHILGKLQLEGLQHVAKDEFKALERLSRAAMDGFAPAQTLVGLYYKATAKQPKKAMPYLYAAAEQGDARAQVLMSDILEIGVEGVLEADALESLRYLRRATDGKSVQSYYKGLAAAILADKYAEGRGVGRDTQEAIRWNRKALEFSYTGNRVDLIHQLKAIDAKGHEQEISGLLAAASKDGDPRAKGVMSDEEWNRDLAVWKHSESSVDFWTRRLTYTGSDMRSNTSIRSTPGAPNIAPSVYSVTNSWKELLFKDVNGNEIKVTPTDGGRTMVINPGQEVIVLYAGVSKPDGNATGFPYRLYKTGTSDVGDGQALSTLTKDLGLNEPTKFWFVLCAVGLVMLFTAGGIVSALGLFLAIASGFIWYNAANRVSNMRSALEEHLQRIGRWVVALP